MGQPLVHPQRLGSPVRAFSCTFVRDEQGLVCPFSILCLLLGSFGLGLLTKAVSFGPGCVPPTKMDINNTCLPWVFHSSWTFISKYFGFFIDTCNGPLGN